jgi:hypothetical protein
MKMVRAAFDIKEGDEKAPVGCQEIQCHGIFDALMAMNKCMTGHVPTKLNPANLRPKVIPGGAQQDCLATQILRDITTM